jgi:hypothetical protein
MTVVLVENTVHQFGLQECEENAQIWQAADKLTKDFDYSLHQVDVDGTLAFYYIIMTKDQ